MRNLKRALSLALASVMVLGLMVVGSGASYADVTSEENQEAIEVLQAVGVMVGDDNGNFNPDRNVTRNEMAVIMSQLLNLNYNYYRGTNPFTDVAETSAYYQGILWAVEKGITTGRTETTFAPGEDCTEANILTFLWRAEGSPAAETAENPFGEAVNAEAYYYKAALWAFEQGMIDETFAPNTACTRAQAVRFMWIDAGSPTDVDAASFTDVAAGAWYADAVAWAAESGVTKGTTATTFTPGPNNIMSMSNASRYGFRRSLPFNFGVFAGFLVVMSLSALFSSLLYDVIPSVKPLMLYVGAAYILWLAWTVWRDAPHEKGGRAVTNTFLSGMALQFVNVKVILYCITTMSSFILPHYHGLPVIAAFIIFLAFVGFACTLCWALFGALFELLFKKYSRPVNAVMALLLVYCAVSMLIDI